MTDYSKYSGDDDYYDWRADAQQHGLGYTASLAYYVENSSQRLFMTFINNKPITAPVFTYQRWRKWGEPDEKFVSFDDTFFTDEGFSTDVIQEKANIIESYKASPSYPADIEEYMWNGTVYVATDIDKHTGELSIGLGKYYPLKERSVRLEEELYQSLYEANIDPSIVYSEFISHINDFNFPYRDDQYSDFETAVQFKNGPYLIGSSATMVINTGDDYVIPIATRSAEVAEAQEWQTPVPGGIFQPEKQDGEEYPEPCTERHVLREFAESFLEYEHRNSDNSYEDLDGVQALQELLDSEQGDLAYTATGIDCLKQYVQLYSVLFIDDPEFYNKYVSDTPQTWEDDALEFVSIQDSERLQELFNINQLNPYHIMGLSEGLQYVEDVHNVELGVDVS